MDKVRREFKIINKLKRELKIKLYKPLPILKKVMRDKEIIKKLLITLSIVLIYIIMRFIPLPGLNCNSLWEFIRNYGNMFSVTELFFSGILRSVTISSLGLSPFLTSCIFVLLVSSIISIFKKSSIFVRENRNFLIITTISLTILLSILQGIAIALSLERLASRGIFQVNLVVSPGWGFRILTTITLTAGVLIALWLAKLITKHGLGNGVAILVISRLICQLPSLTRKAIILHSQNPFIYPYLILLIVVVSIIFIWWFTDMKQKITLKYVNSAVKQSITLRLSWLGRVPVSLAAYLLVIPATMIVKNPSLAHLESMFMRGEFFHTIIDTLLIVLFAYLVLNLFFRPRDFIQIMKRYNCQIEKVELGKETENYLKSKMKGYTLITALFLVAVANLPYYIYRFLKIPYHFIYFMGGISILLIVGVFYDLICQLEAHISMKEKAGIDKWKVADIAFDEIEAEIKKGFLEAKDIPCVIEPLRFTWGLPIKTIVDEYRLHVPEDKREKAKNLLV